MGKAIPRGIKQRANTLLTERPELFTTDFEKNKKAIDSLGIPMFKTTRNLIAGFIVRKLKQKEAEKNN